MTELKKKIHEMCPDGVPMVALGEVCEIKNGKDYKHLSPGNIPVWGTGGIMTYVDQYAYNGPSVLLPRKGSIDKVYYSEGPVWTVDTLFYTIINESKIKPKYLYAVISMQDLRALDTSKGNRPSLTQTVLNQIQIPLPPLPIQKRIVEILDKFTSLVSSLDSEIALRQKQFEYYRELLLEHEGDKEVEIKNLGEICKVITGGEVPKNTIKDQQKPSDSHPFAVYTNGKETYGYTDTYQIDADAVCISSIGANTGAIFYKKGKFTPAIRLKVLIPNNNIDTKYLYYCAKSIDFKGRNTGSVPNINAEYVKSRTIYVPPLPKQQRIVRTLDTFESLLTNLKKERELRQKQYEYYREKLLTFA
jgi:type I restriction enzyme S subunit